MPFLQVGASWADTTRLVSVLTAYNLQGVDLSGVNFIPESIEGMAANPRFKGKEMRGVRLTVNDFQLFDPLAAGVHVVHAFYNAAPDSVKGDLINQRWMGLLAGTNRLTEALEQGLTPAQIINGWEEEVQAFKAKRRVYLLY